MASSKTEKLWAERVRAWRASGQLAEDFANSIGFAPSTLRRWASQLGRSQAPRFVELVPQASVPPERRNMVVEVGAARIRVEQGFDPSLLAAVVGALGGSR